jgi:prepilin-type N-terminal cleavage/methylation domain-containing protein
MLPKIKSFRGFTLIELLVVIAILSVLLVIVLIAINPARQTREARNTQRRADVLTILNSVNQYFIANGLFPDKVATGSAVAISSSGTGSDFCNQLVPDYVAALPFDPKSGYSFTSCATYDTGYEILETAGDRITVSAPQAEGGVTIQATR